MVVSKNLLYIPYLLTKWTMVDKQGDKDEAPNKEEDEQSETSPTSVESEIR